ncbi:MAG: hypothetical protein M3159_03435 [Actinomycetota bacterium]|nr:hypothetical protein [Actinomycetota bacterium]
MRRPRYPLAITTAVAGAVTIASLLTPASGARAAGLGAEGLYEGPAAVAAVNSFSSELGAPVDYAVDYADHSKTWNDVSNPSWLLDAWSPWVTASPTRRLVLGVPLLIDANKGQLAAGAAGYFDTNFRTLAANMVSRGLGASVIRLGWEMNNISQPWYAGTDPASYKAFYARVVSTMRSVPGTSFTFDWNVNAGVQGGSPLTTFDSFYPGDASVDVIGIDNYDIKWMDSTSTPAQRWDWQVSRPLGLNDHRLFATAHAKPVSFPEWGLYKLGDAQGGGGDNPYYVDQMANWFSTSNVRYQAYYDADWGGGVLANFPNGKAQYLARFGPGAAGATSTTVAPVPTTVAPVPTTVAPVPTTVAPVPTTVAQRRHRK